MKLIVGIGNPGEKYKNTRHNVGFMAVDFLAEKLKMPKFKLNKKCKANISKSEDFIFAKPTTFMNNSGEAISKLLASYKLMPEDLIVIHDELDIEFGKIKKQAGRGPAGHNGIKSIIDVLGTKNFQRIRIGVGKHANIPSDKYVLQNFTKKELGELERIFEEIEI